MEMMIRKANSGDIQAIKQMWAECFPDEPGYAEFFFDRIFKVECARVCEADGEIAGMIHVFPRTLLCGGERFSAKYIYGVGTKKSFRGKGIAGRLLESEMHSCDIVTLIPQNEGLFTFYEKNGFFELSQVFDELVLPQGKADLRKADLSDIEDINAVYEKHCDGFIFTERDRDTWELLMSEFEMLGGGIYVFDGGYCAVSVSDDGEYYIDEFFSSKTGKEQVCGFFGKSCRVRTAGDGKRLAVLRAVSEKGRRILASNTKRYINLMHN